MPNFNHNKERAWFNKVSICCCNRCRESAYMDVEFIVNGNIGYTLTAGHLSKAGALNKTARE